MDRMVTFGVGDNDGRPVVLMVVETDDGDWDVSTLSARDARVYASMLHESAQQVESIERALAEKKEATR